MSKKTAAKKTAAKATRPLLDLAGFKKRLKDGRYETSTAALRAVGKMQVSEADKTAARASIKRKFGI